MTTTPDPAAVHQHDATSLEILVAGLAGAASELAQVGRELLRQSVLSRVQRFVIFTVLIVTLVGTIASVVGMGILLHSSSSARQQREQQSTLSRTILDCTKPGGACYERNQSQTAAVIAQLQRTFLISVECGDANDGQRAIDACVARRLKE